MTYPTNDRYLDPPNPPELAKCAGCGEVFYYDEMLTLGVLDYCHNCAAIVVEDDEPQGDE